MPTANFRTLVSMNHQPIVSIDKNMASLGSCFADTIGGKLKASGFPISVNPFGTLFHPYSLFEMLDPETRLSSDLYLDSGEHTHHYRLPKTFFANDRLQLDSEWTLRHRDLQASLRENSLLFLTLGTSFLYQKDKDWVANCHQRPSAEFQKILCSIEDMKNAWETLFPKLPKDLKIVISLSPVRHAKDGLVENNLSKSQLRVLIAEMIKSDSSRIGYFPAYEILLDELRDYRFYASDMLHPSEVAIDYIWQVFQETYLDEPSRARVKIWEKLAARLSHRPLHPDSEDFKKFQMELDRDLKDFRGTCEMRQPPSSHRQKS